MIALQDEDQIERRLDVRVLHPQERGRLCAVLGVRPREAGAARQEETQDQVRATYFLGSLLAMEGATGTPLSRSLVIWPSLQMPGLHLREQGAVVDLRGVRHDAQGRLRGANTQRGRRSPAAAAAPPCGAARAPEASRVEPGRERERDLSGPALATMNRCKWGRSPEFLADLRGAGSAVLLPRCNTRA